MVRVKAGVINCEIKLHFYEGKVNIKNTNNTFLYDLFEFYLVRAILQRIRIISWVNI